MLSPSAVSGGHLGIGCEHELTRLVVDAAKREHPELSDAQAFTKAFCGPSGAEPEKLRLQVCDIDRDRRGGGTAPRLSTARRHRNRKMIIRAFTIFGRCVARQSDLDTVSPRAFGTSNQMFVPAAQ
jgi:hypothetical protein